jgi:hypothetical protein
MPLVRKNVHVDAGFKGRIPLWRIATLRVDRVERSSLRT